MTQDYKDKLLEYLTGNLNIQSGENRPNFTEQTEILNKNIAENVKTKLAASDNAQNVVEL